MRKILFALIVCLSLTSCKLSDTDYLYVNRYTYAVTKKGNEWDVVKMKRVGALGESLTYHNPENNKLYQLSYKLSKKGIFLYVVEK